MFLDSIDVIIPPRLRILQWSCHSFNWKKIKKNWKRRLQKLHHFGLKYNLKQKYNASFASYNLEREDYKGKA